MNKFYVIFIIFIVYFTSAVNAQTYNFRLANAQDLYNNRSLWAYNGTYNQNSSSRISLTHNRADIARYLYSRESFNYTGNCFEFDATFKYYFESTSGPMADGMSFYFASSNFYSFTSGQNLAIPRDLRGIGIVIDFYNNGNLNFSNGNNTSVSLINFDGNYLYTEGSNTNNNKLGHFYTKLESKKTINIRMVYKDNRIKVYFANTLKIDVPYTLNSGVGRFGFSASTGLYTSIQEISDLNIAVKTFLTTIKDTTNVCQNDVSTYRWRNKSLPNTNASQFLLSDTIKYRGSICDSVILNNQINIVNLKYRDSYDTICASNLPYTWNGQLVTSSGSHYLLDTSVSSITNCDSITRHRLFVKSILRRSINQKICASALPFSWNSQIINTTGRHILIDTSTSIVTGCDSITSLTLDVDPFINTSFSKSICASSLPFIWNGKTVNTIGSHTLIDSSISLVTGCDSFTTLSLIVNDNLQVLLNRTTCESELPIIWNNHTITTIGTHVLTDSSIATTNGCDSVTILNLIVNPTVRTNLYDTICQQLLPYVWHGKTINAVGTHILIDTQHTVTNCDSIITNTVWVRPTLSVTLIDTSCGNNLPYIWNSQSVHNVGNHILIDTSVSLLTGCDSFTTLQLVVNPILIDTVYEYACYTSLPFIFNGSSYNTAGYHTQRYQNQYNCDSIVVLNLAISNPVIDTIINITACDSVVFEQKSYATTTTIIDTLFNTVGCDSVYREIRIVINKSNLYTHNVTICADQQYFFHNNYYNTTGKYYANYTNIMGCDSVYVLNLIVKSLPEVKIIPILNEKVCLGDTIILVGEGAQNYLWEGNVIGNKNDSSFAKLYYSENKFEMIGIDSNGCQQNAQITLFAENCCDIGVPNAFSPNNDGLNDIYKIVGVGNPRRFELQIYNRFGHVVYKSYKQSEGWDGTINGKPAEIGTYSYILMTECADGTPTQQKGNIHLIR